MKWAFDNFTKLLGLLSFCLIAAATIHDWAYFEIVGSKFRSIQTTYDYIAYTIEWMPPLFLITAISFCVAKFIAPTARFLNEQGLSGQGIRPFRRQRLFLSSLFGFSAVPFLMFSFAEPYPFSLIIFVAAILLICTALIAYSTTVAGLSVSSSAMIGVMIYMFGLVDGSVDSTGYIPAASNVHGLQLRGVPEKQVMLLRSFEKGVLVRNPSENRIEFIKWDQIEKISHRVDITVQPSGCRWLQVFCRKVIIP